MPSQFFQKMMSLPLWHNLYSVARPQQKIRNIARTLRPGYAIWIEIKSCVEAGSFLHIPHAQCLEVPVADCLVSSIAVAAPFCDSVPASEASAMISPSGGSGALGSGFVAACLTASSAFSGSAWTTCSARHVRHRIWGCNPMSFIPCQIPWLQLVKNSNLKGLAHGRPEMRQDSFSFLEKTIQLYKSISEFRRCFRYFNKGSFSIPAAPFVAEWSFETNIQLEMRRVDSRACVYKMYVPLPGFTHQVKNAGDIQPWTLSVKLHETPVICGWWIRLSLHRITSILRAHSTLREQNNLPAYIQL